jgi:PTH2 family peptidyl-tRNA hydrolase
MNTKQVIVVRKFPNLRTGKYCSQVAHASMSFLTKGGGVYCNLGTGIPQVDYFMSSVDESHAGEINHWLRNSFRKICVYVNSEEELEAVHQKALDSGLVSLSISPISRKPLMLLVPSVLELISMSVMVIGILTLGFPRHLKKLKRIVSLPKQQTQLPKKEN